MKRAISSFGVLMAVIPLVVWAGCGSGQPEWEGGESPETGPQFVEGGVRFTIYAPESETVHLVGDFNNWSTMADPLYDREGNGVWTITIPLPAGRHEYKFLLDGEKWIPDTGNPQRVGDGFGGWNSVVVVE